MIYFDQTRSRLLSTRPTPNVEYIGNFQYIKIQHDSES